MRVRALIPSLRRDAPDATLLRVDDVRRSVRMHRETYRPVSRIARIVVGDLSRESVGEHFVLSGRLAVLQRLEHDLVSCLRLRRAIPAAVKGDEGAVAILLRKALARIEHEVVRGPVRGEGDERI